MSAANERTDGGDTFTLSVRVTLFGYPDTSALLTLRPRPRSWRVGGSVRYATAGLLAAPVVGLVPPHAPWAVGALVGGGILARRRLRERFTVEGVEGACPRCGGALRVRRGRLRSPHPIPCEGCHHECAIDVPAGDLPDGSGAG